MLIQYKYLSEKSVSLCLSDKTSEEIYQKIVFLYKLLKQYPFKGFEELVPAYTTLTLFFEPVLMQNPLEEIKLHIYDLLLKHPITYDNNAQLIEIPVCYHPDFGWDIEEIAKTKNLSVQEVINIHSSTIYKVYMMGFLPGFAYMGKVDERIEMSRKSFPRNVIPPGSIAIAGTQTGIYPLASPGGWQIIGRTPLALFAPEKSDNPFLLKTGDRVRFYAVSKDKMIDRSPTIKIQKPKSKDVEVIKPGVFSTIQDLGRKGFRAEGVPIGGAMDKVSHHKANYLTGNQPQCATLECTMGHTELKFNVNTCIALTGAGNAFLNKQAIPFYQTIAIKKEDTLSVNFANNGLRSYLAVAGGWQSPEIMGSRSTSTSAAINKPLQKGDFLSIKKGTPFIQKTLPPDNFTTNPTIRVIKGPENDWMQNPETLLFQTFILSTQCSRMGLHLQSEPILLKNNQQLISTAVSPGTIQLTPSGQLILLLNDCQTTGGYPRVGQVIIQDLQILAQLKPGDQIKFEEIGIDVAIKNYIHFKTIK